jgi:pilus assembly protein Flp/PilA
MIFRSDVKGQGLVEYAFIMLLVALIVLVILALLGPGVGNLYSQVVPRI